MKIFKVKIRYLDTWEFDDIEAETEEEAEEIALQRTSEESACDSCYYDNEIKEIED